MNIFDGNFGLDDVVFYDIFQGVSLDIKNCELKIFLGNQRRFFYFYFLIV